MKASIFRAAILAVIFTAFCANTMAATILYGGNSVRTYSVDDTATGGMTDLSISPSYDVNALAWDSTSGLLYSGNSSRFFSIDPLAGVATSISTGGFDINALAFVGTTLYGGNNSRFFSIDTATGAMTNINSSPSFNINAMAYDYVNGILYGGNDSGRLFSIDQATGSMIDIGTGARAIRGLAYDPDSGVLYGGNFRLGGPDLFTLDVSNGVQTTLTTSADFTIAGLAFAETSAVPTPGSLAVMLFGVGLVLIRGKQAKSAAHSS